jgi:DnaJ-class molecular chaperone
MIKKYHPDGHTDKKSAYKHMLLINYHYQVLLSYLNKAEQNHNENLPPKYIYLKFF